MLRSPLERYARVLPEICLILITAGSQPTRAIPYHNILWADLQDLEIVINYAHPAAKNVVRPAIISYLVDKIDRKQVLAWIEKLLGKAYGESQRRKRIKVLINPFGGKGSAPKWYARDIEPIFLAAKCEVDVERTQFKGHAIEIAEKLNVDNYDVVASCSGDGLPHEVFNGLAKKADARTALAKIAVAQLPCGSGNAMSWNLNGTDSTSMAALAVVKGIRTPMDLVSITQGDQRYLSFLSQAFGIVAEVDLATEHLRWLGDARFTYGFLKRLLRKTIWPCDIAVKVEIDSKDEIRNHYRNEIDSRASMEERRRQLPISNASGPQLELTEGLPDLRFGTVTDPLPEGWELVPQEHMGNFYCGNMTYMAADLPFFCAGLPHDGYMDLVTIRGDIPATASVKLLLDVEKNGIFDNPLLNYSKISGYRLIPRGSDGYISIDGESVPWSPFQAEVHRGLGTVLSRNGHSYEGPGVPPAPLSSSAS